MFIFVARITKVGYRSEANEFLFAVILRHVALTVYRVSLKTTKVFVRMVKIAIFVESMLIDNV